LELGIWVDLGWVAFAWGRRGAPPLFLLLVFDLNTTNTLRFSKKEVEKEELATNAGKSL
jgi:hypothetical protein